MIFEHIGQQFSVKHTVDTDRCSGCRRCIRACDENVWRWDKEKRCAVPDIFRNVYIATNVRWPV